MLFTTAVLTAMIATAPGCRDSTPRMNAKPPAVETLKRGDSMGDAEKKLQAVPKKADSSAQEFDIINGKAVPKLKLDIPPPPKPELKLDTKPKEREIKFRPEVH